MTCLAQWVAVVFAVGISKKHDPVNGFCSCPAKVIQDERFQPILGEKGKKVLEQSAQLHALRLLLEDHTQQQASGGRGGRTVFGKGRFWRLESPDSVDNKDNPNIFWRFLRSWRFRDSGNPLLFRSSYSSVNDILGGVLVQNCSQTLVLLSQNVRCPHPSHTSQFKSAHTCSSAKSNCRAAYAVWTHKNRQAI